jgi:ATP-dependent helicase/nuclease subunit B
MSLKFIFGGPGSGKTTLCLRDMAKLSEKNNCIFIVPEQFTLESERRLCEFNQKGAVINPQVLSFKRLAYRLSEKSGGGSPLDDSGKVMLLRKITSELLGELEFFVRSANKQGFAEELSKAINEFYQYNISSDTLKALEETLEGGLKIKIGDLRKILARFEEFMRSGYVSSETALESAPKEIAKSRFAVGSYIWLDGFYGFTPQEYDIIEKLMANAERVNVALTLDNDNFGAINDSDPFADIKRAVNRLSKIAKNTGVPIEPPVMLTDHHRFKNSPELAFIEKNFLNHKKQRYKARTENIVIRAAANRRAETESAAVEIITLARKKGLRYKEIAVASGDISGYERSIRRIFDEYGVPFFMDYKTDILSHPLAELLRSAIDCAAFNYNYESVFRFLKTGLTPLSADETDELENYALEFGVSGQKWFSDWKAGLEGDEAVRVNRLREKAKNAFHLFAEQSVRGVKTAKNLSAAVFDMLDLMDVASVIEQWAEKAAERGAAVLAKSHLTAYGKIRAVFDKLVDILGDLRVDIRDFSKIVEAGLMAEDMGFTPPSQDQVIVGDLKRTRLPEIKALIILGANEGVLPAIQKETGVFSDTDRLTLKAAGVEIAPDSRAKNARELLDVYLSLTKPSERLTVSYSLGDFNGKTTRPSQVVFKIADMFPLSETAETDIIAASEPAFGRMGEFLRKTLRGEEPGALKLAWLWFKNNEHYARRLSKLESACEPIRNEAYLSKALTDALYGDEIIIGISRLEQFVKCPFAYYATYGLKARPRRIYEARPADYGLLAHKILENFARIMAEEQSDWRGADKAKIDEFVERYTDDMALGEIFTSSSKRLYMLSRVKRVAK